MHTVQISDDVKNILDRLVAEGAAATGAEFVEQAVRRCAADLDGDESDLVAAAETGLADMRAGNFTTIDGPEVQVAFWNQIGREVREQVAELRSSAARQKA
jgi:predicted transcriptional regulator